MSKRRATITAFEHQTLHVGNTYDGTLFSVTLWESLVRLHASLPLPYFTLTHRGIKLSHYVGVLKTPYLTLDILPKADAVSPPVSGTWGSLLVDMLAECQYLSVHAQHQAQSSSAAASLLDFFLLDFLAEVETLCQRGLKKQYRTKIENARSIKGRLLFTQQVLRNVAHRERSVVQYHARSLDYPMHQLLKSALQLIPNVSTHHQAQLKSRQLLRYFADVADAPLTALPASFTYHRQTIAYRTAVEAARHIVSANYPHLYRGHTHQGFALMFDMNLLFEEFVYQRLRRLAHSEGFTLLRQTSRSLWGETKIRPDIVVKLPDQSSIVIDTKWKALAHPRPSAQDLHQLYVYAQLFDARRSILLYPDVYQLPNQRRPFEGPHDSSAEVAFLRIADDDGLRLNPHLNAALAKLIH